MKILGENNACLDHPLVLHVQHVLPQLDHLLGRQRGRDGHPLDLLEGFADGFVLLAVGVDHILEQGVGQVLGHITQTFPDFLTVQPVSKLRTLFFSKCLYNRKNLVGVK